MTRDNTPQAPLDQQSPTGEYAERGEYHRTPDSSWDYLPTYVAKMEYVRGYLDALAPGTRVLDAGCGEGILVEEFATVYLAIVDASQVPAEAGAPDEAERTHPIRVEVARALAALDAGEMRNGYLIMALQWLARHWPRFDEFLRTHAPAAG